MHLVTAHLLRPLRHAPALSALAALLLCASVSPSTLAEVYSAAARSTGFSEERLARIDARMNKAVEDGVMAGGQGLIARNGTVIYDATWGHADRERRIPAASDTLYRIYSMTKPITSVALLILYEEGHFLLNDPVSRYLPEFARVKVVTRGTDGQSVLRSPERPMTIRDLLRHSAGLSYGVFGDSAIDRQYLEQRLFEQETLAEFSSTLATIPLRFDPGERWHYSVAVDVLGRLIEVISGKSLGEFFQERIFAPLGMNDTHFVLPTPKHGRLAQLYTPEGATAGWNQPWKFSGSQELNVADPALTSPYLDGGYFESGGAGLISSTGDYLRFATMLEADGALGSTRLLAPGTVRLLRSDHLQGIDSSELTFTDSFGLGVGIIEDPAGNSGELGGHGAYGWGGAAGTNFWVDPRTGIVGIFMVQSIPHQTSLSELFRVLTYQAFLE